jgi:hypothetical protein
MSRSEWVYGRIGEGGENQETEWTLKDYAHPMAREPLPTGGKQREVIGAEGGT